MGWQDGRDGGAPLPRPPRWAGEIYTPHDSSPSGVERYFDSCPFHVIGPTPREARIEVGPLDVVAPLHLLADGGGGSGSAPSGDHEDARHGRGDEAQNEVNRILFRPNARQHSYG